MSHHTVRYAPASQDKLWRCFSAEEEGVRGSGTPSLGLVMWIELVPPRASNDRRLVEVATRRAREAAWTTPVRHVGWVSGAR